jgi:hypothetical protein
MSMAPLVTEMDADMDALGAAATGGTDLGETPFAGVVTNVTYTPVAAITGAATNNRTISVINRGQDGTGSTVVATLNFAAGVNAAAFDEKAIPITGGNATVAAGDVLEGRSTSVGTGIADPGGRLIAAVTRNT